MTLRDTIDGLRDQLACTESLLAEQTRRANKLAWALETEQARRESADQLIGAMLAQEAPVARPVPAEVAQRADDLAALRGDDPQTAVDLAILRGKAA